LVLGAIYITDKVKALQCDCCQASDAWKCAECFHLPSEMYDQLVTDENCSLRWYEQCDKSMMENNSKCDARADDRIANLISLVAKLMGKFEDSLLAVRRMLVTEQASRD